MPHWPHGHVSASNPTTSNPARQVLLVVPSELGYGAEGYNEVPGGAIRIFVIDILAGS